MQLTGLSRKFVTITIAAGVTAGAFSYSDLDAHSGIISTANSNKVYEYMMSVDERESAAISTKLRFKALLNSWTKQTMILSSPEAIVKNENFQGIIKMGKSAVPFIIEELSAKPSTLVWALNFIFGRKISDNPNTTIKEACALWVKMLTK